MSNKNEGFALYYKGTYCISVSTGGNMNQGDIFINLIKKDSHHHLWYKDVNNNIKKCGCILKDNSIHQSTGVTFLNSTTAPLTNIHIENINGDFNCRISDISQEKFLTTTPSTYIKNSTRTRIDLPSNENESVSDYNISIFDINSKPDKTKLSNDQILLEFNDNSQIGLLITKNNNSSAIT